MNKKGIYMVDVAHVESFSILEMCRYHVLLELANVW